MVYFPLSRPESRPIRFEAVRRAELHKKPQNRQAYFENDGKAYIASETDARAYLKADGRYLDCLVKVTLKEMEASKTHQKPLPTLDTPHHHTMGAADTVTSQVSRGIPHLEKDDPLMIALGLAEAALKTVKTTLIAKVEGVPAEPLAAPVNGKPHAQ